MKLSFAVVFVVTIALCIADARQPRQNGKRENQYLTDGRAKLASRLADDSNLKQEIIALIEETQREELESLREDVDALKNGSDSGALGCMLVLNEICNDCAAIKGWRDENGGLIVKVGLTYDTPFKRAPRTALSIDTVLRYNGTQSISGGYYSVGVMSTKVKAVGRVIITDKSIKTLSGWYLACGGKR